MALELLVGVGAAAGAVYASAWGLDELRSEWAREASAAEVADKRSSAIARVVEPEVVPSLSPATRTVGAFLGISDDVLLAPIENGTIERVKFNRGGSSISLRIDFANGGRAAFKPRQSNLQTVPRREVAAFRINRMLGLSSVPPAVGRRFLPEEIYEHLDDGSRYLIPRMEAEMVLEDGYVIGEASWWVPVLGHATLDGYAIDSSDGIVSWKNYLTVGVPIPSAHTSMLSQISNMLLFDFLINNPDRWSGGNTRSSGDGSTLYFMDNTLSFGDDSNGHLKVRAHLERCQKFSRSLVDELRHFTVQRLKAAVSVDIAPFDELLSEEEIEAVMARRDYLVAYVDSLIEAHGAQAVLVFP